MNELQVTRTPQLIAAEIRDIHRQTQKVVLYNAIEIGRRLVEAKSLIPHGEWSNWLKESVNYSQSTANNFMRIFHEYGADQITLLENNTKSPIYDRLTYSQAVALLAVPEEEREEFIESHDIENMSTRELQEAIKAKEAAEAKAKEAEEKVKEYEDQMDDLKKEIKEAAQKEKQAAEKKVKELEAKIRNLEESVKEATDSSEDLDLDAEREKIRSELQDEMARSLEKEKKRLQDEIDQAKRELEEKNKRIKELEAVGTNEENQRFKVIFDQTVESFKKLLQQIQKVKETDVETGKKYAGAVEKALLTMAEEVRKYK